MRKTLFLFDAARVFAMAVCVCSVAFLASCDPDPVEPISVIDRIELDALELVNRQTTDEAGKLVYTDQVSVTGEVFYKVGDETESEDVKKETTLTSEAAWSATAVTISALTGEIKKPTITASEAGVSLDFGAFKVENYVVFKNTSYAFTHEGKSVDLPFYGFNSASVSADAGIEVSGITESGKNYKVTTVTQAFKIKHSDGTEKEITGVFEYKEAVEDGQGEIVSIAEKSVSFAGDAEGCITATYVIERQYTFGANSDTTVTVKYKPYFWPFSGQTIYCNSPLIDFEVEVERKVENLSSGKAQILEMGKGFDRQPICDLVGVWLKSEKLVASIQIDHFRFRYTEESVTIELTPAEYHLTVDKIEKDSEEGDYSSWWLYCSYDMGNGSLTGEDKVYVGIWSI